MSNLIESAPGFQTILDLASLEEGAQWVSSDQFLTLSVSPRLWVPIRALLNKTIYRDYRSDTLTFLAQQLEALALADVDPSGSPLLDRYNRLKGLNAPIGLNAEDFADDLEMFTDFAQTDCVSASAEGNANVPLSDPTSYRVALAYFALKGILASVQSLPVHIPAKRVQRNKRPIAPARNTFTAIHMPVYGWLPADLKLLIREVSKLLLDIINRPTQESLPVDLLADDLWQRLPQDALRALSRSRARALPLSKTVANKFIPSSESYGREYAVIYFLLTYQPSAIP